VRYAFVLLVVLMIAFAGLAAIGHNQRQKAAKHDRPFFHKLYNGASFMFCMSAIALLLSVVKFFMD